VSKRIAEVHRVTMGTGGAARFSREDAVVKWTKKDIKLLCGMLDTFVLVNRPIHGMMIDRALEDSARMLIAEKLAKHRTDVVLAGIRGARATSSERYSSNCETVGNEIVRFAKALDDEMVIRFVEMARNEDAESKKLEALLYRVLDEGLPPEVVAYDPLAPKRAIT
jgi:hypothetical protein